MKIYEKGYKAVAAYIKKSIEEGSLSEGDRLPSEAKLCEMFSLSRQTVRKGMNLLKKEGVLTGLQGSGTYVGSVKKKSRRLKYMSVAVMLTYGDSYIFPPVVRGITGTLNEAGYSTQLSFTDNNVSNEERLLKNLLENDNVDALIVEPSKGALPNPNLRLYRELIYRGVQVLFINASYRDLEAPCIRLDDESVGKKALQYLYEKGHRKIGGIFHCEDEQGIRRYGGFMEMARDLKLDIDPDHIVWLDTADIRNMKSAAPKVLSRIKGCTAVMAYNDEVACELIKICKENGMRVPEDLSVIGVDDADISATIVPALTTFTHPKEILGKKAADTILQMMDEQGDEASYLLESSLNERESVKKIFI